MATPVHNTMFGTIVWAHDGGPLDDAVLAYVRETCERHRSLLRIVHVARPVDAGDGERRIAELKATTSSLRRHGINASLHVVRGAIGSPAYQIAELARMSDADLLVVRSDGRSRVRDAVAGGVTQRLLGQAPCPVLILTAASAGAPAAVRCSA